MVKTQNIDVAKLYKAMDKKGIKTSKFCEQLGISRQAFNKKCSGATQFKLPEVYVMGDLLGLSDDEKVEIFFPEQVNP